MIHNILSNLKISSLNPMQLASLEAIKQPQDMVLLSPTGSGKTLGFLLPVLTLMDQALPGTQVLVIVPSRELALQIEQVFKQMATGFKVTCCYGGHATKTEINSLSPAPAIIVGTPGRIASHIREHYIDTSTISTLILDEFDKSLEFGFEEDMSFIIKQLKQVKKRILTSATHVIDIPAFTGLKNPLYLNYLTDTPAQPGKLTVKQVRSDDKDKSETLFALLCKLGNTATLVFCNQREFVTQISSLLWDKGLAHGVFHGGMEQDDREKALIKFRNGSNYILVTTDLAARGLDIPEIQNIIHFQLPPTEDIFIHRNGRTARMHAKGNAYLILGPEEYVPSFIKEKPATEGLPSKNKLPGTSPWRTLYIAAGKKDKINKVDIVGLLLQKGKLQKDELGLIQVLDHASYAAVSSQKIDAVVRLLKQEKIKNKKVKIEISR